MADMYPIQIKDGERAREHNRSVFYERMVLIQGCVALRSKPHRAYRLAVTVAMLVKDDRLFASVPRLAEHAGMEPRTVKRALSDLEAIGLLDSEKIWRPHRKGGWARERPVRWSTLRNGDTSGRTGGGKA